MVKYRRFNISNYSTPQNLIQTAGATIKGNTVFQLRYIWEDRKKAKIIIWSTFR